MEWGKGIAAYLPRDQVVVADVEGALKRSHGVPGLMPVHDASGLANRGLFPEQVLHLPRNMSVGYRWCRSPRCP
jgi:hypothetical protein